MRSQGGILVLAVALALMLNNLYFAVSPKAAKGVFHWLDAAVIAALVFVLVANIRGLMSGEAVWHRVVAAVQEMFRIEVDYGTDHVAVDDIIEIVASFAFTPPAGLNADAGMTVLDVAVPTGFAPVDETVLALVADMPQVKRREIVGRKVIFYIEDLPPDEQLVLQFQARSQYPVRAQAVTSQIYSYYTPNWRSETLGGAVVVTEQ